MTDWLQKDLKNIWHPFTQMKDCEKFPPVLIEKAKGIKLYDTEGNFYYDTISSWWCNIHGHNHPKIVKAINEQLKKIDHVMFAGLSHKPAIELAERLVNITPENLTRVFYSDNGSTSVEVALKISFQYWQNKGEKKKTKFISFADAYHGDTLGAMSVGGDSFFSQTFSPLFFDTFKVPTPHCYRCPCNKDKETCSTECFKFMEDTVKQNHENISGIILEPLLLGAGGMIIYPEEYLRKTRDLCDRYGLHLILDEVAVGFGRTGEMFACRKAGIRPDIICISKGITSGTMPLAATMTTEKIYDTFYEDYSKHKTFYHGHTYTANPIACAAAVACLDIFEEEKTMQKVNHLIPGFHRKLQKFRDLPHAGDVRMLGMIGVVELVKDKDSKQPFESEKRTGFHIYQAALERNLLLRPLGDTLYFFLPLCVTEDQLEYITDTAYDILENFDY